MEQPTARLRDFTVTIAAADSSFRASPGETILGAAGRQGTVLASSCRNGTCRACIRRLVSGQVRYTVEWPGLLPEERDGWVLPCVAVALTDLQLA